MLEHRADHRRRLVVFSGLIFNEADPVYRALDIPVRYFKVAVFFHGGELTGTGYVVDQVSQLDDLPEWPGRSHRGRPAAASVPDLPGADLGHRRPWAGRGAGPSDGNWCPWSA